MFFSVFIIYSFYVSYSGLIKFTKSISFCKIFQAPQKYFDMQKPKHGQNSIDLEIYTSPRSLRPQTIKFDRATQPFLKFDRLH